MKVNFNWNYIILIGIIIVMEFLSLFPTRKQFMSKNLYFRRYFNLKVIKLTKDKKNINSRILLLAFLLFYISLGKIKLLIIIYLLKTTIIISFKN